MVRAKKSSNDTTANLGFEAKHVELEAQQAEGADPRRPRRVPRRQHFLGAEGGPLVAPEDRRPAAYDRQVLDDAMAEVERDKGSPNDLQFDS